jgi:hypothetical protein
MRSFIEGVEAFCLVPFSFFPFFWGGYWSTKRPHDIVLLYIIFIHTFFRKLRMWTRMSIEG